MVPFIAAVIAVIGIGFGAAYVLEGFQRTVDRSYQTGGVRIDQEEAGFGHRGGEHAAQAKPADPPAEKK